MKTSSLSIILFTILIFLGFGIGSAHADNENGVYIQDIQVQPSSVKVGETFTVSATLTNNSTFPIYVDGGKCSVKDTQAELFTITPDSHAKNKLENIFCAGVGWSQLLDSGKSITLSNPDYTDTYVATEPGIATITVKFSYHSVIQKDPIQTSDEQTMSKSFQFQVHDVNSDSSGSPIPMPGTLLPLQQIRSGIAAKDVTCKEGFQLIIKTEDGSPACVKSDTANILVERGWGISMISIHDVLNQEMNGTLSGNVVLAGGPPSLVGPQANYEVDVYSSDGITIVGKALSDAQGNYSIQLPAGIYTIYAPDYPTRQTHHVSVISGKDTILNIIYGTGYR